PLGYDPAGAGLAGRGHPGRSDFLSRGRGQASRPAAPRHAGRRRRMKPMPSRTALALSLVAAWPLLPVHAAEGSAGDDAPLRLTMPLHMELPRAPRPAPAPRERAEASTLLLDPRRTATAGLKLDRVLALHRRSEGARTAPSVARAGRV